MPRSLKVVTSTNRQYHIICQHETPECLWSARCPRASGMREDTKQSSGGEHRILDERCRSRAWTWLSVMPSMEPAMGISQTPTRLGASGHAWAMSGPGTHCLVRPSPHIMTFHVHFGTPGHDSFFHFSTQGEDSIEHTNAKCHLGTL